LEILKKEDTTFSMYDGCVFETDKQNNIPFVDVQVFVHDVAFNAIDSLTGIKFNRDIQKIEMAQS
jgi:hypothetical protein